MQSLQLAQDEMLNCSLVVLNAEVAKALLNSTLFPRQRILNDENVERLKGEMQRGHYIPGTPLYFAVLPSNDMYLLNGRHSLTALTMARVNKKSLTIPFTAIMYRVRDLEAAGHIYSRLDVHRTRTWNDAFRAAGFHERPEFIGGSFNGGWISAFGAAVRNTLRSFRVDTPFDRIGLVSSREMMLRLFSDYLPFGDLYIDSLAHRNDIQSSVWKRSGVMAVGMEIFKSEPKKGYEFFHGASADDGLRSNDPRKVLLTYLHQSKAIRREERNQVASAVALCWNAFRADDRMSVVRPSSRGQVIIDGTVWNGSYDPTKAALKSFNATISEYAVQYDEFVTGKMQMPNGELLPVAYAKPLEAPENAASVH